MSVDGTIAFEAGGEAHRLRLGINAICMLEDRLDRSISAIALEMQTDPRIGTIRSIFWAGLGDEKMTLERAGQIVEAATLPVAVDLARRALIAAFPKPKPGTGRKGKDTSPPTAAAG